jgi:hypothetical protein
VRCAASERAPGKPCSGAMGAGSEVSGRAPGPVLSGESCHYRLRTAEGGRSGACGLRGLAHEVGQAPFGIEVADLAKGARIARLAGVAKVGGQTRVNAAMGPATILLTLGMP